MQRFLYNLNVAQEAVFANKFRSFLTALGIIFGVAAVISMLAIGTGAKVEIMRQIEMVGVNNIIIKPILKEDRQEEDKEQEKEGYSPGLNMKDMRALAEVLPDGTLFSPVLEQEADILSGDKKEKNKVVGVSREYFEIFDLTLKSGTFWSELQAEKGKPVCIIGRDIANRFFAGEEPKQIKVDRVWLDVIGVLEKKGVDEETAGKLSISEYDRLIYIPVETMLIRINDPALSKYSEINNMRRRWRSNYMLNQLSKIVISLSETEFMSSASDVIERMLQRRHNDQKDFEIVIPEQLIKQQQKTRDIFNIVLGAIAGISLLVGGIGIMNIMLASVMERTKEIGIRRALGATKKDVVTQFLSEATLISVTGGFAGVILGFVMAYSIGRFTEIITVVTPISVIISFTVSAGVGIVFGYLPAKRASEMDPVESLRYT